MIWNFDTMVKRMKRIKGFKRIFLSKWLDFEQKIRKIRLNPLIRFIRFTIAST
jgi:hypothetical protein